MKVLPKECDIIKVEEKWQRKWEETGIYRFDWEDTTKPTFTIDTPPPYPSGDFHMGNVLNWTYFDVVARYKRMKGYNVLFPQGWDCHGLPTEVEVEERYGMRKAEVHPKEFRKLCEQLVSKYIDIMKNAIIRLGCSVDWMIEYKTMDPNYWRRTQLSFITLYKNGFIYRGMHPINWCPRCETAIADAEVEHESRDGALYYMEFELVEGGSLIIATTRPELISACVAVSVNPFDERYRSYIGKRIIVPIVKRVVEIIAEESVDPKFGTGVVMICTYGDKADVKVVKRNQLPIIMCITHDGKINEEAGKYANMTIEGARKAVIEDLKNEGLLKKVEYIQQEVGVCWRCGTPIEILEREQWFMRTRALTDEVERNALELKWYPDHMKHRLIDWARSLDWDWVVSRQRVFATPIPIWYCGKCKEVIIAEANWLPIDPRVEPPKVEKCPKCGHFEFIPERDVLDTWFDSSLTCAIHAGWPDREGWRKLFPADLHPSGYDIIRTWAYYLMVHHLALFNERPYKSCLINGMVLGSDGRKMSKSKGNYVAAPEVIDKYGADATRQWALAGGATGYDIPFRWPDVEYGRRFIRKLWNAARFASYHLMDYDSKLEKGIELQLLDKWLLSKLERVVKRVTDALENCQFNVAIEEVRNFTWHVLCDKYIEAVKDRLYRLEIYGEGKRRAAQFALYNAIYKVLQLLAPFMPHITEEIYQVMYAEDKGYKSIHISPWPIVDEGIINEIVERHGDLILALISEVRKHKAERRMPLNTSIRRLIVYTSSEELIDIITLAKDDVIGACKSQELIISLKEGEGKVVEGHPEVRIMIER